MKRGVFVLFILFFISCNTDKNKFVELNEKDAYLLMNEYFLKDIQRDDDKIIFSDKQYIRPSISVEDIENIKKEVYFPEQYAEEHLYDDSEIDLKEFFPPIDWSEKYTKNKWNSEKLHNVSILNNKYYEKANDTISLEDILKEEFGNSRIHQVSYPIYYPKEKMAIIFDEPYDVGYLNCILQTNYYVYLKEKNGWRSLKEYGITGVYGTLHNYYSELKKVFTHKPSK